MTRVRPTGAHHEVGINDMFFSTTDERGVIQESNNVFIRLSRYSRDQLAGAPHTLNEHAHLSTMDHSNPPSQDSSDQRP